MSSEKAEAKPVVDETQQQHAEDEEGSDSDDGCSSVVSIVDWVDYDSEGSAGGKKKKKKKKKKKGPVGSSVGSSSESASGSNGSPDKQTGTSAISKKEADKRFKAAMDLLASNDEDAMWIDLSGCHIFDAKAKKLSEALAKNKQVTSLDLSGNSISLDGAKALAEALQHGAVPSLIELKLRGNDIGEEGEAALAEAAKCRRDLTVETGELPSTSGEDKGEQGAQQQQKGGGRAANGAPSPLVRKYFQIGDDDGDSSGPEIDDQEDSVDAEAVSSKLWQAVQDALQGQPADMPALGQVLGELAGMVGGEMNACALPMLEGTCLDDLKPFSRGALQQLDLLERTLSLVPPPVLHTFDRGVAQPAVGSHRVETANVVVQLLRAGCRVVSEHVAATHLVPRLALLAVTHPTNNTLQQCVLQIIRASLHSDVPALAQSIFQEGWGLEGDAALNTAAAPAAATERQQQQGKTSGGKEGQQQADVVPPVAPLQHCLAAIGTQHVDTVVGLRPPHVGLVIELSSLLQETCSSSKQDEQGGAGEKQHPEAGRPHWLKPVLEGDSVWQTFVAPEGPLERLRAQQQGHLGPPKPDRNDPDDRDFLLGGFGRMLNGQSLLAMLQGLHAGGSS